MDKLNYISEVSVLIITFNSEKFIKLCFDSLFTQDYQDFEVILVDNGSSDRTIDLIKNYYPNVILIENKENVGAAKARNQGIEITQGKWILTLDCDVILEKNFLSKILKFANESEDAVGMIQPKILKSDKKIIYSCGIYLSKLKRFYDIGKGEHSNGKFDKTRYIFGACSAAALYKRQMLEEIKEDTGYFDERFFFLVEDVDLSWRAQRKGFQALYYPEALCYHYGNSSYTDKFSRQYLSWRNRKFLLKKCRISGSKLTIVSLSYDFVRWIFLLLTNPYVRNEIKKSMHRILMRQQLCKLCLYGK